MVVVVGVVVGVGVSYLLTETDQFPSSTPLCLCTIIHHAYYYILCTYVYTYIHI